MTNQNPPISDEIVAAAKQFAQDHIDTNSAQWEHDRRLPREAVDAAAKAGLCGLLVPPEMQGSGLGVSGMAAVMEALAHADMGFAFALVCHNNLAGAIAKRGSDGQKTQFIPPMIAGETFGAFLLTEPGAGSDAAAITTSARQQGDKWILNGEKAWVTNATEAQVLNVYAQTDPQAGARGIAAFLVSSDMPGVIREPGYDMLGAHSTGAGGFRFENVELSADRLFIPPGEAFRAAMEAIDIARIVVSSMCAGMLQRGLDEAIAYTKKRHTFGAPLSERQGMQWMLADVATDLEAAKALAAAASTALDNGDPAMPILAAHAKKFSTRVALSGLSQCMQALGASGYRQDKPLARHLAGAKMAHYLDGTTEVQNIVISRSLFRD